MMGKTIFPYLLVSILGVFLQPAEPAAQNYFISDPDTNQILSLGAAREINEYGLTVGIGSTHEEFYSGVVWEKGIGSVMLPVLDGDEFGEAFDIADNGDIVGTSVYVEQVGHIYYFYNHAVIWKNRQPIELETIVTNNTGMELWTATCVNENNQICGWGRPDGTPPSHGFFIDKGVVIDLGQGTTVEDINERGHFVGRYETDGETHAFVWKEGTVHDLHDGGVLFGKFSEALAINEFDVVVGVAKYAQNHETATIWDHGATIDLGTLGGNHSRAWDINDHGTVVGVAGLGGTGGVHAFVYRDNSMHDMNDLIAPPTDENWILTNAMAISNNGTIVGDGFCNSIPRPFIAVPDTNGSFRIYGSGCAGSGGYTPALYGQGDPTSEGAVSFVCVNGLGGAYGLALFGTGYDTLEFRPGCLIQIMPLAPVKVPLFLGGTGSGAGGCQIETWLPAGTAPGTINMQILFADPGGSHGYTITNALEIIIG